MPDLDELAAIRRSVEWVGRLSDGLLRIGPWSIGLDGVLSWVPGLGEVYSAGAAAFLLTQGARAGVPWPTLFLAALLMGGRTLITVLPVAGPAAADLLTMHKWSARLIMAAIDRIMAGDAGRAGPAKPPLRWPLWRARRGGAASTGLAA